MQGSIPETIQTAASALDNGDRKKAHEEFARLAAEGSEVAMFMLAEMLMRISSDGVHQDFQAARTWYKRHYESTNDDLSALGLAKLHFKGHGVELDLQRALGYLTPHLVSGDARLNMLAGRILSARDSSTFDCQGGIEQFKLAVMKGNSYARKFLGWTYVEQGKYISGSFQLLRGAAEVFWFALRGKEDRVRPY